MAMIPMAAWVAASAVTSAVGAVASGVSASNNAKAQQQAYDYQAKLSKLNAESASAMSSQREDAMRTRGRAMMGEAMAGVAQSGTGFGGSNKDIIEQNAVSAELDALNVRYEGQQQARGLMAQGQMDSLNARIAGKNTSSAMLGGFMSAGAGLLSSAGSYYGNSKMYKSLSGKDY